jgi:hypothetical protein
MIRRLRRLGCGARTMGLIRTSPPEPTIADASPGDNPPSQAGSELRAFVPDVAFPNLPP